MMICTAFLTLVIFTSGLYMQEVCPSGQDPKCIFGLGRCYFERCPNGTETNGECFPGKPTGCLCCTQKIQDPVEACPCGQDRKCNSRGGKCYLKECPNYLYPIGSCQFRNKDCKDCVCCAHRKDPVDPVDTAEACPCGQDIVCNKRGGKCYLKECPKGLYPIRACRFRNKDCKDCVCCAHRKG